MANETSKLGLLVQLLLDKAAAQDTKKGIEDVAKANDRATKSSEKFEQSAREEKREVAELNKTIRELAKITGLSETAVEHLSDELFEAGKAAVVAERDLARVEKRVADLNQTAASIDRIAGSLFVAGSSIVGAIFLAANQEAQRVKEAGGVVDETTQRWLTAQQRIQLSYRRIGSTAGTVFLPVLEKIAALAEKGSKFVEQHPDLVKAALNTGLVIATVGAVGMLVSKGIRFYADLTLISAQLTHAAALDRFSTAITAQKITAGGATTGAGSLLAQAAPAAGILLAGAFLVELERRGLNKVMGTDQSFGDIGETYKKYLLLPLAGVLTLLEKTGPAGDKAAASIWNTVTSMYGLNDSADELTDGLDDLSASTEQAKSDIEGMKVITQLEKDNIEAERELAKDRAAIISDSNDAIAKANTQLAQSVSRIKATLSDTLSRLAANFSQANQKAEQDYQTQRGDIIRDGNEEVLQIHKDSEEELRKLEQDFAEQRDELTRSRDALGLVKAQREFDKNKEEIERNTEEEIAERRRQTQIQLADLRRSYERERAERLAKYQQDVLDARAKAAQELVEAQAAFAARMKEIQSQKAQELAELQRAYNEERRRRIIAAYEQIQDLGNALNAERLLRSRYYSVILAEAELWMSAMRRTFGNVGSGTIPTRHSGGWTGDGLYAMKKGEYVLTPGTASAAESLIGTQLSQQALLSSIALGSRGSFTLNDGRRFDSSIPLAERRAIEDDAVNMALSKFANALGKRR